MFSIGRLRYLMAGSAIALLLTGSLRADLTDSLVAHWPFDGDLEDKQGDNHGTLMGTDDEVVFESGILGDGIFLDGIDQYVEIDPLREANFDFINSNFSVSAWFQVEDFTKSWQALIAKGEGNRWRVHRRDAEGFMSWNGGNADVPVGDSFDINDQEWHHFVGVSTPEEVLMYIDGELISVGPAPAVENNDMPLMIGENPDARGRTWFGMIDDIGIWERPLTEDEISQIYNNGEGMAIPSDGSIDPVFVQGQGTIGRQDFNGQVSNRVLGPDVQPDASGFSGRMVTFDEHQTTLDNQTVADVTLEDFEGTEAEGAYPFVDLGGGQGSFPGALAYPNGVNDESQDDFVVEVTANVTIPAGEWTIGFGSDDGGQLTIEGVEFLNSMTNDSVEDDQIRFEATRGHGWTVGSFELSEDLETTLTASFFERGGGDSFEIAITEGEQLTAANSATWDLLQDGALGWEVTTEARPLISGDLGVAVADLGRPIEFDVDGDSGESDQYSVNNPAPDVFTTVMDVDGLTFQINATGNVTSGQAFQIINADQINGDVTITSVVDGQNWVWDAATGRVCLDTCPGIGGGNGDYNNDGVVDVNDLDAQAVAMQTPNENLDTFDENNDGTVDFADRNFWLKNYALGGQGTWVGDADLNGEFDSSDFVTVFTVGKYETGTAATWGEGDWNGDGLFNTADFVAAFTDGGYNAGPIAATSAVPEPASAGLALLGMLGLFGIRRRR